MKRAQKLHLGCGNKYIPGYIHIDALSYQHVDYRTEINNLTMIADDSVELIYACHVLEHFGRHEYLLVLAEWYKKLKLGGTLRLAVPNFQACINYYLTEKEPRDIYSILGLICGGQRDQYDYHKMIFDENLLKTSLLKVGFNEVQEWDWKSTEHSHIDDYSQSYLPHMDKESGMLMSLNLEAVK